MFQRRKELETFSFLLEQLLNGKRLTLSGGYKDKLPSKILHQLTRLSEKMHGTEERLKQDQNELRETIAELAHQMRNPLANMEGYLELLSTARSEEERQEYLAVLMETEGKLHFLTESFIKMARLESRIIQIKPEAANLSDTILKSILQVKKAADAKQIVIEFTDGSERNTAHDANWLGEAVYNLLENSVKYSPVGSIVKIAVIYNEMYTRISVSDSGIGIREGEEGRIFQKFYRGKDTGGQPGFGLGLYLSREIVLMHGGFVKARRRERGMEISVFLP